jgi:hypothetical protein
MRYYNYENLKLSLLYFVLMYMLNIINIIKNMRDNRPFT